MTIARSVRKILILHFALRFCNSFSGYLSLFTNLMWVFCMHKDFHEKNQQNLLKLINVFCLKRGNFIHSFACKFSSFVEFKFGNLGSLNVEIGF